MDEELYNRGMEVRRKVLGDKHIEHLRAPGRLRCFESAGSFKR